jgi:hypothetical protein
MSSAGELHIDYAYDLCSEKCDEIFGKEMWYLEKKGYYDLWDKNAFPDVMRVDIFSDEDDSKKIGELVIFNKFVVEQGMGGKYIEVEIEDFKIEVEKGKCKKCETKIEVFKHKTDLCKGCEKAS